MHHTTHITSQPLNVGLLHAAPVLSLLARTLCCPRVVQLREGSPSTLWYSSSAAASSSATGVGASRIPAQYHHMFHYDGPQPHEQHSPYGSYVDDASPAQAAFGAGYEALAADDDDGEAGTESESADPSHHPPSSYMHSGFLHHVPEWMKKETEQQRNMAHRGGNTAEDRLLAHKRRQEQLERERATQKDAL